LIAPGLSTLILAGGSSVRFGSPKQLTMIRGKPMLQLVVEHAVAAFHRNVIVVLGAYADEIAPLMHSMAVSVVVNEKWREGIAASIRSGVARVPGSCEAALILLGDQPCVTSNELRSLQAIWRRNRTKIIAAEYDGRPGVPAVFPRSLFSALLELRGDTGAQSLLRQARSDLILVPTPSAAIDVDTPLAAECATRD
jgi:molybdenum cofactor cytidylyltransferase